MSTELLTWLFYGIYKRVIYIELFAYAKNIPKKKERAILEDTKREKSNYSGGSKKICIWRSIMKAVIFCF